MNLPSKLPDYIDVKDYNAQHPPRHFLARQISAFFRDNYPPLHHEKRVKELFETRNGKKVINRIKTGDSNIRLLLDPNKIIALMEFKEDLEGEYRDIILSWIMIAEEYRGKQMGIIRNLHTRFEKQVESVVQRDREGVTQVLNVHRKDIHVQEMMERFGYVVFGQEDAINMTPEIEAMEQSERLFMIKEHPFVEKDSRRCNNLYMF